MNKFKNTEELEKAYKELEREFTKKSQKLAQAQKTIEIQKMTNDALIDENLDYRYDITNSAYEQAKGMASNWESQYQEEIKELKKQLAESEESHHKNIIELTKIATEKDRKIEELKQKLEESEEQVKHWHDLYNERDKQFQSVRQRYHLLNKLQSNYDKKDKLHLAYMQCAELVEENEQLKQQLAEKDKKISNLRGLVNERDKQIKNLKTNKKRVIEHKNNVKISFCIEKLEKVKEFCDGIKLSMIYISQEDTTKIQKIIEEIDNQINELKEMK
jgi:hypothetical protein